MVQLQRKEKGEKRGLHPQAKSTGGGERSGRRCRDCWVCYTRTMRASYRHHQKGWREYDGYHDCVLVVRAYGLRGENRTICLQTKGGGNAPLIINAASQVYKQTTELVSLGGATTAERHLTIEITRRLDGAWACSQRYKTETYDHPGVSLR